MKILLYGPSGSGKSTVGKLLAQKMGFTWIDLDPEIEKTIGTTIEAFFSVNGEASFREIETNTLMHFLNEDASAVISLGGGALLNDHNREKVEKSDSVIVLTADVETLLARLSSDSYVRPLIKENPRQYLTALLARRQAHYASFGEPITTDDRTPDQIVREIQTRLGCFRISGMGKTYDVLIKPGLLDQLGSALNERGFHGPAALVCDQNVEPLYAAETLDSLNAAGFEAAKVVIPAGEEHKTIQTIGHIWEGFLQAGVERSSLVIALGGGVTGDLTGFAAATYLRGVPWINLPTTLLAMVDSSLGGKTGADLPQGKNLIGAFHSPSLVLTDPQVLSTLPPAELRSGLAETLKHGIISDPDLYHHLDREGWSGNVDTITSLICQAVAVKAAVIESDPYEKNARQALNFGHTIGHGIEKASDYHLSHGESVSIGMIVETRLSEKIGLAKPGLADLIGYTLSKLGLPVSVPSDLVRDSILQAVWLDKKRSKKQIHFALPEALGKIHTGVVVDNWQELIEL